MSSSSTFSGSSFMEEPPAQAAQKSSERATGFLGSPWTDWSISYGTLLTRVVWKSTDDVYADASERALLKELANLPVDDDRRFRQMRVHLPGSDRERFINTIVVDQAGFDVPGERQDVVIVNGLGAAVGVFFRNLEALSRRIPQCRLWAIDWLGMGRSGRPPFPEDPDHPDSLREGLAYFLDAFEEWRQAVQIEGHRLERFILVGHSLGGYLSTLYALGNPHRVQKLVLASPAGLPPDHNGPEASEAVGGVVAVTGQVVPAWLHFLWANNYTPQWFLRKTGPFGPRLIKSYIKKRLPVLTDREHSIFAEYMFHVSAAPGCGEYALGTLMKPGAWAREPLHDRITQLRMPVAFIYGQNDWMDYRHAEEAAARMKVPTRIIRVPNSGHQLYLENPEDFNKYVIQECSCI